MTLDLEHAEAVAIAAAVRAGHVRARDVLAAALDRIEKRNGEINAFTAVKWYRTPFPRSVNALAGRGRLRLAADQSQRIPSGLFWP